MVPKQLTAERFHDYPAEARQTAQRNLALLQQLPLAFVPLLLRELVSYDWKFPAERRELDAQLRFLNGLNKEDLAKWMAPFAKLQLAAELEQFDWVNDPATFSEHLTAHLWATHQVDAFRTAAVDYVHRLNEATPPVPMETSRLTMVAVGHGVEQNAYPLFRKLRPQGVLFKRINPENGTRILLDTAVARANSHPVPFAHWYVDGGSGQPGSCAALTCVSYQALEPIRSKLLSTMETTMRAGSGSEALRSKLARIRPEDLGLSSEGDAAVLDKFQISLLTEGSGTQIFSTTFVQWTAREALRRAQPLTLFARFTPRRHEQSMSEMLANGIRNIAYDPAGSLIDADMGAYYTWINQQRLKGADKSAFLVWFEGHSEALAIGPSLARGAESNEVLNLQQLVARLT